MESHCTLASKQDDLIVCDLVSKAHIRWNPLRLVHLGRSDLLPRIPRDIIHFYRVDDLLLIDTTSECKDVVVLEGTERGARPWNLHLCNNLPLIFLRIVHLTIPIDSVAYKSTHDIDEVLNCAD